MAKILNIEIDTAQLRVAETDSRGLRIYRCFTLPVPQGACFSSSPGFGSVVSISIML